MKTKKKENKEAPKPKGIPIPAGTEQETGLTRGETEKAAEEKAAKKFKQPLKTSDE